MIKSRIIIAISLVGLMGCSNDNDISQTNDVNKEQENVFFSNPIISERLPDPSIIHASDGYFYVYATQKNEIYIPIYKSTNMIEWEYVGAAFKLKPEWQPNTRLWAPDINYINGKYVLYYSLGNWDKPKESCIGVAVSDYPNGPFVDKGKLLDYNTGNMQCIDPYYYEEDGKKYLFWGSFKNGSKNYEGGIRFVELNSDGLSIKNETISDKIAGPLIEGISIHKHNGYYYLFGSTGNCCDGGKSTYRVLVGRSKNIAGPYVGKDGNIMNNNSQYNEVILESNSLFAGPGHNSEIITDDKGDDWILYHAWQRSKISKDRQLMCDQILWSSDDWPYFVDSAPSKKSRIPFFNDKKNIKGEF